MIIHTETVKGDSSGELTSTHSLLVLFWSCPRWETGLDLQPKIPYAERKHKERGQQRGSARREGVMVRLLLWKYDMGEEARVQGGERTKPVKSGKNLDLGLV